VRFSARENDPRRRRAVALNVNATGDGGYRWRHASVFVGQWAPTLLILGLYNKLVKQLGSDATDRPRLS
jgi:hypothetical protein